MLVKGATGLNITSNQAKPRLSDWENLSQKDRFRTIGPGVFWQVISAKK